MNGSIIAASPTRLPVPTREDRTSIAATRWSEALAGAGIAIAATVIASVFGAPALALGIPAAAVAGSILGPRIRAGGALTGPALAMAAVTILIGDTIVVAGMVAGAPVDGQRGPSIPEAIVGAAFFWTAGLFVVGIPMLLVAVPCGILWAFVVRRLTDRAR